MAIYMTPNSWRTTPRCYSSSLFGVSVTTEAPNLGCRLAAPGAEGRPLREGEGLCLEEAGPVWLLVKTTFPQVPVRTACCTKSSRTNGPGGS